MNDDQPEWHNPECIGKPGEGYRFLTKEEVRLSKGAGKADYDCPLPRILFDLAEFVDFRAGWKRRDLPAFRYFGDDVTYRVPITAEIAIKPPRPSRWPNWDLLCKT